MILRLLQLRGGAGSPQRDLGPFLLYDETAAGDAVLRTLDITPAWMGVALRSQSVEAWRNLWAWLVEEIAGLLSVAGLGERFASQLPAQTLNAYIGALPDRVAAAGTSTRLLPAEPDCSERTAPDSHLAVLLLGGLRLGELSERVRAYFEGPMDQRERLSPSWLAQRIEEWRTRSVRDFGIFLVEQMLYRSQQIALSKSWYDKSQGQLRIPTRVFLRDGQVFRDWGEPGGGISLRWDTLTTVLAGVGWVSRIGDRWQVTDEGLPL
jgi:hypothetical protein